MAQLSDYLKVSQPELVRWLKGEEQPTPRSFLDVVDLLLEHDMGEFSHKRWAPGNSAKSR